MMMGRFGYDKKSQVIEIASNDGYLLQYFKEKNIPVSALNRGKHGKVAKEKGIKFRH